MKRSEAIELGEQSRLLVLRLHSANKTKEIGEALEILTNTAKQVEEVVGKLKELKENIPRSHGSIRKNNLIVDVDKILTLLTEEE